MVAQLSINFCFFDSLMQGYTRKRIQPHISKARIQ